MYNLPQQLARASVVVFMLLAAAACPEAPGAEEIGDPETPPEGDAAMRAWLDEEHYLKWACEDSVTAAVSGSPHGRKRVCSNAALSAGLDEVPLPVGAATVKEIYDDDERTGFAVMRKVAEGEDGDAWYWWERLGLITVVNERGASGCVGCHEGAAAAGGVEFVYTVVR